MSYEIKNKITLVTGANRGIGKSIVDSFVKNGAVKIYAGVRSLEKADNLVAEYGEKIVPIRIDYNDPESLINAENEAKDVEIVVSNAGILMETKIFDDSVIENFEKELEVNVYGLLRIAKAFAPVSFGTLVFGRTYDASLTNRPERTFPGRGRATRAHKTNYSYTSRRR